MRKNCFSVVAMAMGLLGVGVHPACAQSQPTAKGFDYPTPRRSDQVDVYHGVTVADPYRWLEDTESPETRAWIDAENKIAQGYLETPQREAIKQRLTKLWNYERFGMPFKEGDRYFMTKNNGLQPQSVLYVLDELSSTPRVLIDPNTFSTDGTVAVGGYSVSPNGRLIAYAISDGGSDWRSWKVRDIDTGNDLADAIEYTKFSGVSWSNDNTGFYYSGYDAPTGDHKLLDVNYFNKLKYHRLGTPQSADTLVYERPDQKEWSFGGFVTDDGRYLMIDVRHGTRRERIVLLRDLTKPDSPIVELIPTFEASYDFIDNDGPLLWFRTDDGAPNSRVISIDVTDPAHPKRTELIPEGKDALRGVSCVGNRFFAKYLHDAKTVVKAFELTGKPMGTVDLPGIGSASGFFGKRRETETFYRFGSFTTPGTIYRYDTKTGTSTVFKKPRVDFDESGYETKQIFATNKKDGTRIPIFLTWKKSLKRGDAAGSQPMPTLLYGYGGFNIAITPRFSVTKLVWMDMGGVYASANIRGGGEYGKAWHEAGAVLNKQNCFDDFIAAAEHLIATGVTSKSMLAISGRSNGGLLVGACMTQRPDLFGACLPGVGVLDMLRFEKFTIGWAWSSDYGTVKKEDEFKALRAYSPLHNVGAGIAYPPTLITTADRDDRVVPGHSFKFAAAMQHAHTGAAPMLIRIQTRAGHGGGKPTAKRIEEAADELAFLARTFGIAPLR